MKTVAKSPDGHKMALVAFDVHECIRMRHIILVKGNTLNPAVILADASDSFVRGALALMAEVRRKGNFSSWDCPPVDSNMRFTFGMSRGDRNTIT